MEPADRPRTAKANAASIGGPLPRWLNRSLFWLFVVRALRSASQGYLGIIVPLYIALLGYDAVHLGIMLAAASVASALLAAAIGILSDRFGRKNFLIFISLLVAGGALVFAVTRSFMVLVIAGAIGTIGRGGGAASGGNWGPFYPAEQALIAEHSGDTNRTTVFGALSFVGVLSGALGSLLAWAPRLLQASVGFTVLEGYRLLFWLTALFGLAMAAAVLPVREVGDSGKPRPSVAPLAERGSVEPAKGRARLLGLSRNSWGLVVRFSVSGMFQGLSAGMLGPLVVYWFYRRYGVGADVLANLFFLVNLAAALPYLLAGRMARLLGSVNSVVLTRMVGTGLLIAMVMMPSFWLAAVMFTLRMVTFTLAIPVAQSYLMGIMEPQERASAAGLTGLPWQASSSVGPYLSGYLMQYASLDLPFELAAAIGGFSAVLYYVFFRAIRPPEEVAPKPNEKSAPLREGTA